MNQCTHEAFEEIREAEERFARRYKTARSFRAFALADAYSKLKAACEKHSLPVKDTAVILAEWEARHEGVRFH